MKNVQRLQQVYSPGEARAIYEMVMECRFGLSRTDLLLGKDTELSAEDSKELENIMLRLLQSEPVQYILGQTEFCGHTFHVEPGVLIPRPETQELVQLVERNAAAGCRVLDVGTGSGCIAISLALMGYQVTAFDISDEALAIARGNAKMLRAMVDFRKEDILHQTASNEQWDAIVSNPPYICWHEASQMDDNVLRYEPDVALFVPNEDPLLFYRTICRYGCQHLSSGGMLFFEVNREYATDIVKLMYESGYADVQMLRDQFGNERMVWGRRV